MLIDWFTVAAQAVNFVILVWLLKRFLYKPILRAVDEREKRIAAEVESAKAKEAKAQEEMEEFRRKNEELQQRRDALLRKAADDAKAERHRLMEEARGDCENFKARLEHEFETDHEVLKNELASRTQHEVFAIARKTLSDLASADLDDRITKVFAEKIKKLDSGNKEQLATALKGSNGVAIVRSAFDLSPAARSALEQAIGETAGPVTDLRFETAPHLLAGIELLTNNHKLAWSIDDYLAGMETSVRDLFDHRGAKNDAAR